MKVVVLNIYQYPKGKQKQKIHKSSFAEYILTITLYVIKFYLSVVYKVTPLRRFCWFEFGAKNQNDSAEWVSRMSQQIIQNESAHYSDCVIRMSQQTFQKTNIRFSPLWAMSLKRPFKKVSPHQYGGAKESISFWDFWIWRFRPFSDN